MNPQEASQDKIHEMKIDDHEPFDSTPDISIHDNLKEDEIQNDEHLSSDEERVEEEFEALDEVEDKEFFQQRGCKKILQDKDTFQMLIKKFLTKEAM